MPAFSLDPAQTAWCAELRTQAAQRLRPLADQGEPGHVNRPLLTELGRLGLLARLFTSGAVDLCLMRESLAYACTEAETALALQGLGAHPVHAYGTPAQRDRWLPRVAEGTAVAAFALSEPGAGSDAAALTLRADPEAFRPEGLPVVGAGGGRSAGAAVAGAGGARSAGAPVVGAGGGFAADPPVGEPGDTRGAVPPVEPGGRRTPVSPGVDPGEGRAAVPPGAEPGDSRTPVPPGAEPGVSRLVDGRSSGVEPGVSRLVDGRSSGVEPGVSRLADGRSSGVEPGTPRPAAALDAESDGASRWRLSGEKCWISNAPEADFYTVFARTTPGVGARGVTAFLVPADRPGLTGTRLDMLSPHPIGALDFDAVPVTADDVLGEVDRGFRVAMGTLNLFRPSVGAFAVGMAQAALDATLAHTSQRDAFGGKLRDLQTVAHTVAEMALRTEAARLMVYAAATAYDESAPDVPQRAAMAKLLATETAQYVVDAAVQLHGARALRRGHLLEHLYREVRAPRVYEGASEVQRGIIAKELYARQEDP